MSKWTIFKTALAHMLVPPVQAATTTVGPNWGGISWEDWVSGNFDNNSSVTEQTARGLAAVHACTALIAGSLNSMPIHVYKRVKDDGREKIDTEVWSLLNERPHPNWSAAMFWQYVSDSRLFHGDSFSIIGRKSRYSNEVVSLDPVHPMTMDVLVDGSRRGYRVNQDSTVGRNGTSVVYDQADILHIPGSGFNGVRSLSAIKFGLQTAAGIALAGDEQSKQFFKDGVRADFAIEIPTAMSPDAQDKLRKTFLDRHSGAGSKRAPIVLAGGMKLHQLTMTAEDAETLATRSFQIEEICRVFGVPPFMIGHTAKTTSWGTGIEQMSIGFVKYTLSPHLTTIEQEVNFKLLPKKQFAEFQTAGLERGDLKTRYEAYRIGLGRAGEKAWLTVNGVRALENLPPVEGGDEINDPEPALDAPDQTTGDANEQTDTAAE